MSGMYDALDCDGDSEEDRPQTDDQRFVGRDEWQKYNNGILIWNIVVGFVVAMLIGEVISLRQESTKAKQNLLWIK
jgi:predicted cobalt transporter CbtA